MSIRCPPGSGSGSSRDSTAIRRALAAGSRSGQAQTELQQLIPDVAARETFDHSVDRCGVHQPVLQLARREPAHGLRNQLRTRAPDPGLAHQLLQLASGRKAVLDVRQRARLLGNGPQYQRGCYSFAAQAVEHAHEAHSVRSEKGLAELEDVVAGNVEHNASDLLCIELAGRKEQRKLLYLLMCRK